jgi:hypothetical protein
MGNVAAGRLTSAAAGFGAVATVLGAAGGFEGNTLAANQSGVAPHDHPVFLKEVPHSHVLENVGYRQGSGTGINFYTVSGPDGYIGLLTNPASPQIRNASTNISIGSVAGTANDNKTAQTAAAAAAAAHANVQPTLLATFYLKL